MALNLTNLFTALGRIGRNAYIIASGAQDLQETPFDTLVGYAYINPAWVASLAQSYDAMIRSESGGMGVWSDAAATILQGLVSEENAVYGSSLGQSLAFLNNEMVAQNKTIAECTIGSSVSAEAANVGSPAVFVILKRGDGIILQNTIAEEGNLLFTSDSYTGGATAGQEPWQYTGAPNVSSLGTGVAVGLWDWDWPQGSGVQASGVCIAGDDEANEAGNFLTNGDFESWTGATPVVLDYWKLTVGTWGTSITRSGSTEGIDGGYCVEFVAGAVNNTLTQQFDSSTSDGTDATAGTVANPTAFASYAFNVWLKADGVISAGVMTVSLVDGSDVVIADQSGTNNSTDIALTAHDTDWVAHPIDFRLPVIVPDVIRLKIAISTDLAGANLFMDWAAFCRPTNLYAGGPNVAVFSEPAVPIEAGPDPDGFQITFTNDRAGASFGATFQTLVNRLFQAADLILPYSGSPDFADTLITNA